MGGGTGIAVPRNTIHRVFSCLVAADDDKPSIQLLYIPVYAGIYFISPHCVQDEPIRTLYQPRRLLSTNRNTTNLHDIRCACKHHAKKRWKPCPHGCPQIYLLPTTTIALCSIASTGSVVTHMIPLSRSSPIIISYSLILKLRVSGNADGRGFPESLADHDLEGSVGKI